jgi:hypothetical protein
MNTDRSVNVVVIEVLLGRRLEKILGESPTKAADGIRRVWDQLAREYDIKPADVRRVYAQWEPSPDDRTFLATEFPAGVKVCYSFPRPSARREWGEATREFERAVDDFWRVWEDRERVNSATGVVEARARPHRPRRPWWQYWDWPGEGTNPLTPPTELVSDKPKKGSRGQA